MDGKLPTAYTKAILDRLARQACVILGVERAVIFVRDEATRAPVAVAGHGVPSDLIGRRFRLDEGMVGQVLSSGEPMVLEEYGELRQPLPHEAADGVHAAGAAPISWEDDVQGAISVGSTDP